MPTADTNRGQVQYSAETSWGETPSGPAMTEFRITSENIRHNKQTVISQEVRADRQRADMLEVGVGAAGDINFELVYGNLETFFEGALQDTVASAIVSEQVTIAASSITASAASGSPWSTAGFKVDQWVRVTGASVAANSAVVQITEVSTLFLGFKGTTLAAETSAAANVTGRRLRNGTTNKSFLLEKRFNDIAVGQYFTGMRLDGMQLNIEANAVVTGVFSFIGKEGADSSTQIASTVASASANKIMTAAGQFGTLREGGTDLGTAIQTLSLQIANNSRPINIIGQKQPNAVTAGGLDVSGSLRAFFEDLTLLDKFLNHSATNLSFRFTDIDDNVVVVTVPQVYYGDAGGPDISGQDADVFVDLQWQAVRDATNDYSIQMDFLPAG